MALPRRYRTMSSRAVAGLFLSAGLLSLLAGVIGTFFLPNPWLPRASLDEPSTLTLTGSPGEVIEFQLTGSGPRGYWAAPSGLVFTTDPGPSTNPYSTIVVQPKARGWPVGTSEITEYSTTEGLHVDGQLKLPDQRAPDSNIRGHITGKVERPFDRFDNLDVNVELRLQSKRPWRMTDGLYHLISALLIPFGVACAIVGAKLDDRQRIRGS